MPSGAFNFSRTFESDAGLPEDAYGGEFMNDDETNGLFPFVDADVLQLNQATYTDSKALGAASDRTTEHAQLGAPGYTPDLHRVSSSSGSSRSDGSNSSRTGSRTSPDIMMTKDIPFNNSKTPIALNGNGGFGADGTVDFLMDDAQIPSHFDNNYFDFESASIESASSSPSAVPAAEGHHSMSPEAHLMGSMVPRGSPNAKRTKTHMKAQSQHSLTQGFQALRTTRESMSPMRNDRTTREASMSPMYVSNGVSPATGLNTPSPENRFDFSAPHHGLHTAQPWGLGYPQAASFASHGMGDVPAYNNHRISNPVPPPQQTFPTSAPKLVIQSTPLKSRVETQIPIKMVVYNMPPMYKRLHLPPHTISKAKLLAKQAAAPAPDMLELYTMLVCTSAMLDEEKRKKAFARAAEIGHPKKREIDPVDDDESPQNGGEVRICNGCITRERKRAGRKKNKKPEEDELWENHQYHRAIVFNTNEVKEWQIVAEPAVVGVHIPPGTMQVDAPMRIACYCRHHAEKVGFKVIFTIKDFQGRVVAQEMSSSIMITDDHKTHVPVSAQASSGTGNPENSIPSASIEAPDGNSLQNAMSYQPAAQSAPDFHALQHVGQAPYHPLMNNPQGSQATSVAATPQSQSRQVSPVSPSGPASKKRKASGSVKVPSELAMTRIEAAQPPPSMPMSNPPNASAVSAAQSPFSPPPQNYNIQGGSNALFANGTQSGFGSNAIPQAFAAGSVAPNGTNGNDHVLFSGANRNMSMDNLSMPQPMFSAPASTHPSRAPSPNSLRNDAQQSPLSQALYAQASINMNVTPPAIPTIHKIIPNEGPKSGGIEVTILGRNFTNDGLEVMFGEQRATTTTYWGETSLVCLLPPSSITGPVVVSIRQPRSAEPPTLSKNPPIFRYHDDNEDQLMRTALAVLGTKFNGQITDVASIARSIIQARSGGEPVWGAPAGSNGQGHSGGYSFDHAHTLETALLQILEIIDLDDSIHKVRINLRRSTGQTMLHLACSIGMIRFVAGLLSRGANPGARDKGGFTPLHFAAMNNHPEIVRRLIIAGADPTMRSLSGLRPVDLAPKDPTQSREVVRALRRIHAHERSRSGGSLQSRANSATSLRSLWDPPAVVRPQEFMSDSSDRLDSSDSYEDSSEDEPPTRESEWLNMRRASATHSSQPSRAAASTPAADVPAGMASPTAAMTAFRDQCAAQMQQFQQTMAMHLQNLPQWQMPQMPQMPQLPHMPVLPDYYHNYLHNAPPVMQRIASLVPAIGTARPDAAEDQVPRDRGRPRWEMPSILGANHASPPAYEELFPQKQADTKQDRKQANIAAAATAAAECALDEKCATMYDQDEATTAESSKVREMPTLLQIGHKNAITKEQQENLQRAHAQRLKTGSSDKMLWFVWIPLLTLILGFMLFNGALGFVSGTGSIVKSTATLVAATAGDALQQMREEGPTAQLHDPLLNDIPVLI